MRVQHYDHPTLGTLMFQDMKEMIYSTLCKAADIVMVSECDEDVREEIAQSIREVQQHEHTNG